MRIKPSFGACIENKYYSKTISLRQDGGMSKSWIAETYAELTLAPWLFTLLGIKTEEICQKLARFKTERGKGIDKDRLRIRRHFSS